MADLPNQNPNNSEAIVNREIAEQEKLRQVDFLKEQMRKIRYALSDTVSQKTEREKFAAAQALKKFDDIILKKGDQWLEAINRNLNNGSALTTLRAETDIIEREIADDVATIESYMGKMNVIHENDLSAMLNSSVHSSQKIAELILEKNNYPEIIDALKYVLNRGGDKNQAFQTFEMHLSSENSEVKSYIWTVMSFLNGEEKIEFAKEHTKKNNLDSQNLLSFLEEGNKYGVYSHTEMQEVLEETQKYDSIKKDFDKKKEQYAAAYKITNDFKDDALRLSGSSYGSKNAALEALNIKNGILFVAQLAAGLTIVGNIAANVFEAGKFHPRNIKYAFNDPTKVALAALVGISKRNELGEFFKGSADRKADANQKNRQNFKNVISSNAEVVPFLKGSETYSGTKALYEYSNYVYQTYADGGDFPESMATKQGFETWLKVKGRSSDNPELYREVITKLKNSKINDEELGTLAKTMRALNIKDAASYNKEIEVIKKTI